MGFYTALTTLQHRADYWSVPFEFEHMDNCFIPDGYERHQVSSCQLHFSVCGSLPEGICEGHPDTAACQEVVTEDGLRHYYSIGESRESYKFKLNGMDHSMYLITKFICQFQCCNILGIIFDSTAISYPIVENHKLTELESTNVVLRGS